MSTINFSDIELKNKIPEPIIIKYGDSEIEVKQWIPTEDKYNLIMITLQQSAEDGVFNEIKLDMYFNLNVVYKYSNIEFTADNRINVSETFDKLNSSGLLAKIFDAIPEKELDSLEDYLMIMRDRLMIYGNNVGAVIKAFIEDMPKNAEKAKEIIESFDKEKYKEVIEFAQAANGGRPIPVGQK